MKVVIIGGGVIGLCTAYYLRKTGLEVTVIDRNTITNGCSFGNMGYVSPSHFTPLASPGIISKGLKWMMSSSSPFYIKPRLDIDLVRWGMTFWRSASKTQVEQNTPHLNNLLQLSRELMNDLKAALPANSFDMIEKGCWMLYKQPKTGEHEKHLAEQAEKFGLRTISCSAAEVQDYETEVEVNVAGGVLYLDDCHIDTGKFMQVMYRFLQETGVKFWVNTEVKGFASGAGNKITAVKTGQQDIACDEVVIANGSWLGNVSRLLGIRMLMQPGKGYSMVYSGLEKNLQYPSILVDDRTATTPINGWLRIGGTMELSGHSDNILPKRVMAIHKAFGKYYPTMNIPEPDPEQAWYGYRPVTPDGLPYIGRHSRYSNLSYAGGHAMLGVSAAAATGQLINEIIQHKPTTIDISAFNPERFR
ncbi:MAG: FAD-dependent oxidoreductase [Chitinophagaceae bacterium]|nr:FAD-dependent oxidoreductase [Chitinophagaceae bacterium]